MKLTVSVSFPSAHPGCVQPNYIASEIIKAVCVLQFFIWGRGPALLVMISSQGQDNAM